LPSPHSISVEQRRGVTAAAVCYFLWGLVPIFWKQLADIDAVELIAHRHLWSLVFVALLLAAQGGLAGVGAALPGWRAVGLNFLSGTMLTANWLIYVWGVNHGRVIECSLGYFLVPLVNVATGRLVLDEHLRPLQWTAIALAGLGVGILVWQLGHPPWIALGEAASWGVYSLMRKQSPLAPLVGLAVETLLLAPLAIGFLAWQHHLGAGALGRVAAGEQFLVLTSGIVTAVPLLLFAYGAQRIRLSTLGLLQYIAPTAQFALAILLYHEPFTPDRLLSFGLIWAALALYTFDNLVVQRR
jgi:chloramphenicol-sensitive protein RarD